MIIKLIIWYLRKNNYQFTITKINFKGNHFIASNGNVGIGSTSVISPKDKLKITKNK